MIQPRYKVVVQEIVITWSKASQGGLEAAKRNAVPQAFPLPLDKADKVDWFLFEHQAFYHERDEFTTPSEYGGSYRFGPVFNVKHLNLEFTEDIVSVVWAHESPLGRGTKYVYPQKRLFTLQAEEWGKIVYNHKASHIWYQKTVINVGVFIKVDPNVFTQRESTHTFNNIAQLY